MLETQLVFFKIIRSILWYFNCVYLPSDPRVDILNYSVINDMPIERHMKWNQFFSNSGTYLHTSFLCNTPDHSKIVFTVFIDIYCLHWPSKHRCIHPFWAVICDIHRAINRYTFFGNGGVNLHTKFYETHQITLKMVLLPSLILKTWVKTTFLYRYLWYWQSYN